MARNLIVALAMVSLLSGRFLPAQERVRLGTGEKTLEVFYLPMMAAEEKGIWSRNGLKVEWVPFTGGGPLFQGVAAGHVKVSLSTALGVVHAIARGLPAIMVAEYQKKLSFAFHVSTKNPAGEIKDLKGQKIGISGLGSSSHMIGRIMGRAAGVERDLKFVAVGGVVYTVASLRAGIVDAVMTTAGVFASQVAEEEVKRVGKFFGDTPEGQMISTSAFARKEFVKEGAATLSRLIKALAETSEFVASNPAWSVEKIKSEKGWSQKTAEYINSTYSFTGKVAISPERVERLRMAFIEFGLVKERELPSAADLFTNIFVP